MMIIIQLHNKSSNEKLIEHIINLNVSTYIESLFGITIFIADKCKYMCML